MRRAGEPERVGIGGSSQAGWVAAQAVRDGATPAFVFLLGAAGAAMTVEEQNVYNTGVRMHCDRFSEADIDLALRQQRAFFAARRSPASHAALASITARGRAHPQLEPWLFPGAIEEGATKEWYDVLDPDFDPLSVWRGYSQPALFLFGTRDDSTDSALARARLGRLPLNPARNVIVISDAQHIGLRAKSLCTDLSMLHKFHPATLNAIRSWARQR